MKQTHQKGRGAQINPANPFNKLRYEQISEIQDEEVALSGKTRYIPVFPKTVLNKITSPDVPGEWSLNPYQGCEHGCVYCYARNTHPYWGYSAGIEFEEKILVKQDVPALLEKKFRSPKWKASPLMLSGNTDCYQPAEKKYEITRKILEICWKFRHPVGVITKNALVLRDLDLLRKLASEQLVHVAISITSLDEKIRAKMEPRTSTAAARIEAVRQLSVNGIPVSVMLAPVIPGLTDHEILPLAKAVSEAGARSINYTVVRLNGDVAELFEDWLDKFFPDRKEKVLNHIREAHGGKLNDSRFGQRMSGEGELAAVIARQVRVARQLYFEGRKTPPYNLDLHAAHKDPQLRLF
ncbi:MAG: PA0069 family radical SAM protein [Saprospiraceae bacterium]|nr:PA0069 family radical SAM protein [Saprospiraceae bacterium]